jgi:hypothetical protein
MTHVEWLRENLQKGFALPSQAIEWLIMLYEAIQVFDDIADGDTVNRKDLDTTIWNTLIGMNQNPFWIANSNNLAPVVATAILKWQASDKAERENEADAKSYVWRAGYYDVVLITLQICHGTNNAKLMSKQVMQMYGETYEDYMKEFNHA